MDTVATDVSVRRYNRSLVGISFFLGVLLSSSFWIGGKVYAEPDAVEVCRQTHSQVYETVDRIKGELGQVDHALESIKEMSHAAAVRVDVQYPKD